MANNWALILGASSGFGEATSLELAKNGYSIFGVHLDLRATLPNAERIQDEIRSHGQEAVFFNINAADDAKRTRVVEAIQERLREEGADASVRVLLHSLAFGTLRPFVAESPKDAIRKKQFEGDWQAVKSVINEYNENTMFWTVSGVKEALAAIHRAWEERTA